MGSSNIVLRLVVSLGSGDGSEQIFPKVAFRLLREDSRLQLDA